MEGGVSWADLIAIGTALLALVYSRGQAKAAKDQAWGAMGVRFSLRLVNAQTDDAYLVLTYEAGPVLDYVGIRGVRSERPEGPALRVSKGELETGHILPGMELDAPCTHVRERSGWAGGDFTLIVEARRGKHQWFEQATCRVPGEPIIF